jgi:hypothetical protein
VLETVQFYRLLNVIIFKEERHFYDQFFLGHLKKVALEKTSFLMTLPGLRPAAGGAPVAKML